MVQNKNNGTVTNMLQRLQRIAIWVFAVVGLVVSLLLVGLWVGAIVMSGKVVQREQVIVALAGETPSSVAVLPCGAREEAGKIVGDAARASFWVCEGSSYVILPFKDFDAICTIPYTSGSAASPQPFRFRIVGHKCQMI
jgi:hypothetical protein